MKKTVLIVITGLILIACVCVQTVFVSAPPAPAEEKPAAAAAEEGYVVRDSGGRIAVFMRGGQQPVFTTGSRTDSLPKADARRVREGIEVDGKKQLERLLEDLCS